MSLSSKPLETLQNQDKFTRQNLLVIQNRGGGNTNPLPQRCERRRKGLCRCILDAGARRCRSDGPLSIKAIQVTSLRLRPSNIAYTRASPNFQKRSVALFCCPCIGWWNARLPGQPASGGWSAIMSDLLRLLLACLSHASSMDGLFQSLTSF